MSEDTSKTSSLTEQTCTPCRGDSKPLEAEDVQSHLSQLSEGWQVVGNRKIEKTFKFKNFADALDFTNKVGKLAELQQHHPDIHLTWGKVRLPSIPVFGPFRDEGRLSCHRTGLCTARRKAR